MRSKEDMMSADLVRILAGTVRSYVNSISYSNNLAEGYVSTKRNLHFGFIPTDTMSILEILYWLYKHMRCEHLEQHRQHRADQYLGQHRADQFKFLDIGCGIGNVVLLAYQVGFDAYGLEYNKKIYDIAKNVLPVGSGRIFKGDMIDFKRYNQFDVLYYYVPMNNVKAMKKFVIKLMKAMKCGAYVIPNGFHRAFNASKEFDRVKLGKNRSSYNYYRIYRKKRE